MIWIAVFLVAVLSGATASIVGFGIGSLLTPLIAIEVGMSVAVAAVMVPHAMATAVRCWRLRRDVDREVLRRFGVLSAAGSLAGAVIYTQLETRTLTRALGGLLILTALAQLLGWASRWRPRAALVAILGFGSGLFGGLAGNQGGLRAAALTAFDLTPVRFVATATATALLVDAVRAPVYLWTAGPRLAGLADLVLIATVGVLIGTVLGERLLFGLSPARFARIVGIAVGAVGIWLLTSA
jgi:uncharacterized protein